MTIGGVKLEAELLDTPNRRCHLRKAAFHFHCFHLGR